MPSLPLFLFVFFLFCSLAAAQTLAQMEEQNNKETDTHYSTEQFIFDTQEHTADAEASYPPTIPSHLRSQLSSSSVSPASPSSLSLGDLAREEFAPGVLEVLESTSTEEELLAELAFVESTIQGELARRESLARLEAALAQQQEFEQSPWVRTIKQIKNAGVSGWITVDMLVGMIALVSVAYCIIIGVKRGKEEKHE